jgi:mannose-6-phosphate isomerase-like protein (cupin superfamily)
MAPRKATVIAVWAARKAIAAGARGRVSIGAIIAPLCHDAGMGAGAVVVRPGEGHRVGNVEFLARTADTPRFTFGIIEIAPGRVLEPHVHAGEDDAFYILEGELTFGFGEQTAAAPPGTFVLVPPGVEHGFHNAGAATVRMLNIHAPAGFDRRIGLSD